MKQLKSVTIFLKLKKNSIIYLNHRSFTKAVLYEETKFLLHKNAEMNNELNSNQTKIDSNTLII